MHLRPLAAAAGTLLISIPLTNAYTGDLTHFTPAVGSCGVTNGPTDNIVALSHLLMQNPANPNLNPICNKQIKITNPDTGTTITATVTDTCGGCKYEDVDATDSLFVALAPQGDGRVPGIQWEPVGWTLNGTVPGGVPSASSNGTPGVAVPSATSTATTGAASIVVPSPSSGAITVTTVTTTGMPAPMGRNTTLDVHASPASIRGVMAMGSATALSSSSTIASTGYASMIMGSGSATGASNSSEPVPTGSGTVSSGQCTSVGQSVCSANGTQIGLCTSELKVTFGPVAKGTKCVGGYQVWI